MATTFSHEETRTHLLEMIKKVGNDKSWRVRYIVAEKFVRVIILANAQIAQVSGTKTVNDDLLSIFIHLLKDMEAEVKTAAATQIPGMMELLTI